MKTVVLDRTKAHQVYKLKNGVQVVGATTILGILDKPALLHWAWNLGMKGLDFRKVKDQAADVGTIAHFICESYVKGYKPDLKQYASRDINLAKGCAARFIEFWREKELTLVSSEKQLVSNKYRYGGTIDIIAKSKKGLVLLDLKTSKGIYDTYWHQLAAYEQLHLENGGKSFLRKYILRIGKEDAEFEVQERNDLAKEWKIFQKCTELYYLLKK